MDKNNILKKIAKILVSYNDEEYLQNIKDWGRFNYDNKMLVDIIDDINDEFKGFNNIFNDVCDDDKNNNKSIEGVKKQ
jgi:hypothetical protein